MRRRPAQRRLQAELERVSQSASSTEGPATSYSLAGPGNSPVFVMNASNAALAAHPVEGGSANDYEYACGDPVNAFDTTGTVVSGICGNVELVGIYGGEFGGCFVTDDQGTRALIGWAGFGVGADAGASFGYFYLNAPTVDDLAGWSACGSVNIPYRRPYWPFGVRLSLGQCRW